MIEHPAKFTDVLISEIGRRIPPGSRVLDPFAGTGRIHQLWNADTVGVEIEPEWASMHPKTVVGNALVLPFKDHSFDAIATSPCYGNRMADHHNARDGSKRMTYRHMLGRELHPNNSGQMQWGDKYRAFHAAAWVEARRVLRPGGLFVLNISDHIRKGTRQRVTAWHVHTLLKEGFELLSAEAIPTPRMKRGENAKARVGYESVIVFEGASRGPREGIDGSE